jgi:hypothetical protein
MHCAVLRPTRALLLCCGWQVLDAAACADMGMGCYLGVAEASLQPPAFIHLTYKPQGEAKKKVRSTGAAWFCCHGCCAGLCKAAGICSCFQLG